MEYFHQFLISCDFFPKCTLRTKRIEKFYPMDRMLGNFALSAENLDLTWIQFCRKNKVSIKFSLIFGKKIRFLHKK